MGIDTLLHGAESVMCEIHELYNAASFTKLEHDFHIHGPWKTDEKTYDPYAPNPPQQAFQDENLWQTMGYHFGSSHRLRSTDELQEIAKNGISFVESRLRGQLLRIFNEMSTGRPSELQEARSILTRMVGNISVLKKCAALFSGSERDFPTSKNCDFGIIKRNNDLFDYELWDLSRRMKGKAKWSDMQSMQQAMKSCVTRILKARRTDQSVAVVGYYTVKKSNNIDYQSVHVVDGASYNDVPAVDSIVPDFADILVADLLSEHVCISRDLQNQISVPQLHFD